jgi:hypothetical protein
MFISKIFTTESAPVDIKNGYLPLDWVARSITASSYLGKWAFSTEHKGSFLLELSFLKSQTFIVPSCAPEMS